MSDFTDKLKTFAATVAPKLATALGGPLAGWATAEIARALGAEPGDQKALSLAMANATPEQLLALKKADQDFQVKLRELDIDEEKLSFDDLASARAMQIATRDPIVAHLAWTIIGGFLLVSVIQLVALMGWAEQVNKIPPQGWLLIGNISGYLASEAKQAAAFYFGSSMGSQKKDAILADIAKS